MNILSDEEYKEHVPSELREPSESTFHFVVRNPQALVVPLKMGGDKKIFKLDKSVFLGARNGLRRV